MTIKRHSSWPYLVRVFGCFPTRKKEANILTPIDDRPYIVYARHKKWSFLLRISSFFVWWCFFPNIYHLLQIRLPKQKFDDSIKYKKAYFLKSRFQLYLLILQFRMIFSSSSRMIGSPTIGICKFNIWFDQKFEFHAENVIWYYILKMCFTDIEMLHTLKCK